MSNPMKPIIILPPEVMSKENINLLRENGLCVVVAADPGKVRFIDPIPSMCQRSKMEDAAIQLSRKILTGLVDTKWLSNADFTKLYVDLLVEGTPLQKGPTKEELEAKTISDARETELWEIGREEARAQRAAKKLAKQSGKKP